MGHLAAEGLPLRIGVTVGVAALLALTSWRFNARIDNLNLDEMHDGQTALQVAVGVTYTLAGIGVIVAVWTTVASGVAVFVTSFITFAVSGFAMYVGDARRSRRRRVAREHDRQ